MKVLHVVPRRGSTKRLRTLLDETERRLRGSRTTFVRQRAGRWRHKAYKGWISLGEGMGGVLVAEVHSRAPETEWQLLRAFVGYLDRHLAEEIESISILYR